MKHLCHPDRVNREFSEKASLLIMGWACAVALTLAVAASPDLASAACPNEAFRTGASASLPNCRAYEKVSPADKEGHDAHRIGYPTRATADGEGLSFLEMGAYANSSSGLFFNGFVARRGPGGWITTNVTPPGTPEPTPPGGALGSFNFNADLSEYVAKVGRQTLAEGADPQLENLFHRSASGSFSLVNTNPPPPLKLPEECPIPSLEQYCLQFVGLATFAGASADFRHLLVQTRANLIDFEDRDQLFQADYVDGSWELSPVGILPDGELAPEGSAPGSGMFVGSSNFATFGINRVTNAISANGSRVFFQANSNEGEPNEAGQLGMTQIYARLNGAETIEVSAPAPGASPAHPGAGPALFWGASEDGNRVFFTSPAELTTESNTGPSHEGNDLYEYDFERTGGELVDLTAYAADPAGARVVGVLDASDDGSYVYFVARAQLDGSKGEAGAPNLYVIHEGSPPSFIATLDELDETNWTQTAAARESYVTPSGEHVAFTSRKSIPSVNFPAGYNNVNPATGEPVPEVYLYSAESGELFCASCNPTGTAPEAPGLLGGVIEQGNSTQSEAFQQVRALSDDGSRLFFDSKEVLVDEVDPANRSRKVYQWERPSQRGCTAPGGCIDLISGAAATNDSVFMEASADGSSVFLITRDQLLPTDQDVLLDIYNARADGGFPLNLPPAPCRGEECRTAVPPPPASGAPATAGFRGRGNVRPETKKRCRRGKVKRKGRCVRRQQQKRHHRNADQGKKKDGGRR